MKKVFRRTGVIIAVAAMLNEYIIQTKSGWKLHVSFKRVRDNQNSVSTSKTVAEVPAGNILHDQNRSNALDCMFGSNNTIELVLICDRIGNTTVPTRALVNSLLMYTSRPLRLHIVTAHAPIDWIDALHSQYFTSVYHDSAPLRNFVQQVTNQTGFHSVHHASDFVMQKLFIPLLHFPPLHSGRVLLLDDDMVFYRDVAPLYDIIMAPSLLNLSLLCPLDRIRYRRFIRNHHKELNGRYRYYCITGMMGVPVTGDNLIRLYVKSMTEMVQDYPGYSYRFGDQDVVNRVYASHWDQINHIPCQWSCDYNSCHHTNGPGFNCKSTAPGHCYSYHFLGGTHVKQPLGWEEWEWTYYYKQNPLSLLHNTYIPRLQQICQGGIVPEAGVSTLNLSRST
jgi:lipopolysaccharide biosynthesis glycosyltransferase